MNIQEECLNFTKQEKKKSNDFTLEVAGDFAMFGTPLSKQSCEMISYPMPTYSALCGIMNSIYYRPGIKWVIDQCRVMNEVKYINVPIKTPHYKVRFNRKKRQGRIFIYSFLIDARYQIRAHYEIDNYFINDIHGYCSFTHDDAIREKIKYCPEKIVSLGKRCCGMAFIEECEWNNKESFYDNLGESEEIHMFHSFLFDKMDKGRKITDVGFCKQKMERGIIDFRKISADYTPWNKYRGLEGNVNVRVVKNRRDYSKT